MGRFGYKSCEHCKHCFGQFCRYQGYTMQLEPDDNTCACWEECKPQPWVFIIADAKKVRYMQFFQEMHKDTAILVGSGIAIQEAQHVKTAGVALYHWQDGKYHFEHGMDLHPCGNLPAFLEPEYSHEEMDNLWDSIKK